MSSVVDANCWASYVEEKIRSTPGKSVALFDLVRKTGGFLFDDGKLIWQQYADCRRGFGEMLLNDFFERAVLGGYARLVPVVADRSLYQLLISLGVPRKEHIYFQTAVTAKAAQIVSNDIDFFDPQHKESSSATRGKVMSKRTGKVCKSMRKEYSIEIHCVDTFLSAAVD